MKQIRKRLTYANVMSSLAVFLILGGASAYAAVSKVGANEIKANSIKTGKIVKEAVVAGKIKNGAIIEGKLADGAVTTNKLADNAVTTPKIAKEAVNSDKLGKEVVNTDKLGKEVVTDAKLKNEAVTTNKLAGNSVTTAKLANDAVTQAKVGPGAIGSAQLKGLIARTGTVSITNGNSGFASANCEAGETAVSAGTSWSSFENGLYTNYIRILGNGAQGRGNNFSGATRTFTVEVYCLPG